jgi:hypothetical protein
MEQGWGDGLPVMGRDNHPVRSSDNHDGRY